MENFGSRLKQLRQERDLSQSALARRLKTSPRMLLRWEKGEGKPSAEHLINLSRTLGVSVDELLGLNRPDDPVLQELNALTAHLSVKNKHTLLELVRALTEKTH